MDIEMTNLETDEAMNKAVEFMIHEFSTVRTGKASPALVEGIDIYVHSYGSSMKLKQLAMITTPEPRMIMLQPFDASTTQDIERGIRESKLGINPNVNGKVIRLPIPELTGERRRDMVKMLKGMGEDAKVRVRAIRRDAVEAARKAQKDKAITEDDLHGMEEEIQSLTDKWVKDIDVHIGRKEAEILSV
jgi:ribosome recycling factor